MTHGKGGSRLAIFVSTLALLGAIVSLPALAGAAGGAKFSGTTKQRYRIQFLVRGNTVKVLRFKVRLRCRDGGTLIDTESGFEPARMRGGKFNDHQRGSSDDVFLRGKVRGKKLTGTLRVTDKIGGVKCDSRQVKFTARRR